MQKWSLMREKVVRRRDNPVAVTREQTLWTGKSCAADGRAENISSGAVGAQAAVAERSWIAVLSSAWGSLLPVAWNDSKVFPAMLYSEQHFLSPWAPALLLWKDSESYPSRLKIWPCSCFLSVSLPCVSFKIKLYYMRYLKVALHLLLERS